MNRIITGTVIHGNRIGRTIDFPTANIAVEKGDADDGVYAARVNVEGQQYPAMVNVGTRPTVADAGGRFAEAHIFEFDRDIYGLSITIELLELIRPERRFPNLEQLKLQLAEDKKEVLAYLGLEP